MALSMGRNENRGIRLMHRALYGYELREACPPILIPTHA